MSAYRVPEWMTGNCSYQRASSVDKTLSKSLSEPAPMPCLADRRPVYTLTPDGAVITYQSVYLVPDPTVNEGDRIDGRPVKSAIPVNWGISSDFYYLEVTVG
jgi:hypothetical protein